MTWSGQVALVTGGSRGIGRATVRRLAAAGAAVGVNYARRAAEADAVVQEILTGGGRAISVQTDIGDAQAVERMVTQVTDELGPITILVNNAGVMETGTLETYDPAALERMRRTNVDGLINVSKAVARVMKAGGYGRIVNLTSIAGHGTSLPGTTFYAATKAAVDLLTRRFALELGRSGITVNAVAPGYIATDMTQDEAERHAEIAERAIVGRVGQPEDIAHAIAFLAAPEAGFITGQTLTVDGGRTDYIGHR